jgi:hypothetical protein
MIGLLAFLDLDDTGSKKIMIMGLSVPFTIFHLIGLVSYKGASWKKATGITLFMGATLNIFVVITMLSIKGSPEITEVTGVGGLNAFSDYISGFTVMVVFMGLGAALYLRDRSSN